MRDSMYRGATSASVHWLMDKSIHDYVGQTVQSPNHAV